MLESCVWPKKWRGMKRTKFHWKVGQACGKSILDREKSSITVEETRETRLMRQWSLVTSSKLRVIVKAHEKLRTVHEKLRYGMRSTTDPVDDDPKAGRPDQFQIKMMEGLIKNQPVCCLTCFCAPCSACYVRYKVLDGDLSRYTCCQGYFDNRCCQAGNFGESSAPQFCLCMEACCCVGPSMSSSRLVIMDAHNLRSDPCDNRIIRFSNCLALTSCICDILAIFIEELRLCADAMRVVAEIVFYTTIGCMAAQVLREVDYQKANTLVANAFTVDKPIAPISEEEMKRH